MVKPAAKRSSREAATDKIRIVAYLTLAFSLASYLGTVFWVLELTAHFKLQYLVISVVTLPVLILLRDRRGTFASLLCVVLNGSAVLPWYVARPTVPPAPRSSRLRLLLSNVLTSNRNSSSLVHLIDRERPDVLI